jgi:hypothetical protein
MAIAFPGRSRRRRSGHRKVVNRMEALNRTLAQRFDGLLYHYTSQRGLLGILNTGEIWATDMRYLNDSSEFRVACDCAVQIIHERVRREKDPERKEALEELGRGAQRAGINVSVASFSAKGDLLSQWRAYGGSSGYSVGFEYDALKMAADAAAAEGASWLIGPCIYDSEQHIKVMAEIVNDAFEKLLALRAAKKRYPVGGSMAYYLNRYAGLFKDRSFSEESEWRLISRPLNSALPGYSYREGPSYIVPYFKFPLARLPDGHLRLKEIIVGPTPHPDLATSAVESLLASKDLDQLVQVKKSQIPYRNW